MLEIFKNLIRSVRAKEIPFKSFTSKSGQRMQIIDPQYRKRSNQCWSFFRISTRQLQSQQFLNFGAAHESRKTQHLCTVKKLNNKQDRLLKD